MSAPFRTTFNDALARDLRHLHSGLPVRPFRFRHSNQFEGAIDVLDRIHEGQRRKRCSREPAGSYVYVSEYDTVLPRAPAFEQLKKREVALLTERLSSTDKQTCSRPTTVPDGESPSKNTLREPVAIKVTPRSTSSSQKQYTQQDVTSISDRLYRGKTKATERRQRQKVDMRDFQVTPRTETVDKNDEDTLDK